MPFKQVTEQDLKGKGVIGQPAVPGLSVTEMQKSVEQVVREAAIPAHNQLCEQLEAEAAAADIGAAVPGQGDMPPETPKKLQSVLEAMLAWAKEKLGLKADKADTYTKQETEEKISEGISETGFEEAVQEAKQSAQEAKEYAESINPAQFAQAKEGVTTVNASKVQNTFDIELPNSNQFVIIPNAAYASGDTFKIAAQPVAAKLPNGDSLPDGFFEAGAKVLCLLKDNVLYFTGGGNAPGNVMRYRMDDSTPGQQPEQTIWGQTSDGQDAYVHSCTKAVYNPETGKTLDEDFETMAIHTYTCVTSGTNHALTGTGNNIKFVADSDFAEGDTISVNGTAVTAQTQGGETLGDGAWVAGAVVMCYLEGSTLNFNEGAFGAVKSGQIIFASALNSMNVNTYTNYDSPYFLNGICKKSCNVHFFAAIGYQAQYEKAFTFSVTVNGEVKLSTNGPDGGTNNINRDMGTLEINKGDVVSASFPIGAGGANQRGGAIIGVLN